LEAIIGGIVKRHGFDFVRDRVVRNGYRDTAIRSAFGSGLQATPSVVHEALRLYLDDLHSCAGDMLAGLPLPDFDY
jgi:hypothetical protein